MADLAGEPCPRASPTRAPDEGVVVFTPTEGAKSQAPRGHRYVLAIFEAGKLLSQFPLCDSCTLIGRGRTASVPVSPKVQLWVCDKSIAPEHALVSLTGDGACVEALHSEQGTFLDGQRIAPGVPIPFPEQGCLVFGTCPLEFRLLRLLPAGSGRDRRSVDTRKRCGSGASGRPSGSKPSRSRSPTSKRRLGEGARQQGSPRGLSSPSTSSGAETPVNQAAPPPPPPKSVRWSPDMVRVHEVPGLEYPPDYFESTSHAIIFRNMIEASSGDGEEVAAEEEACGPPASPLSK